MAILTGSKKTKTAVFISGKGSNLRNLIKFSKIKNSPICIQLIISDNSKAKGLKYGKIFKIRKKIFNFEQRNQSESKILATFKRYDIKMVLLAGFMKILSKNFITKFKGKILNIHPSLLPKYKGLNSHKRALNDKEKYSGCTVHFVNARLDSGKIILQKKVRISKKDTESSLAKKILAQEHKLYPKAILKVFNL